ncbi:MAG: glycosyltransferase [Vicinamibacterales bacterium]
MTTNARGGKQVALRGALRAGMHLYLRALQIARVRGRRTRAATGGHDVLITAHYASAGWGRALLAPLAASLRCRRLRLVATAPDPGVPGLEVVAPPRWLRAVCGATVARLMTFVAVAVRTRPDVVGGVHLLLNGLTAALAARLAGARAMYICVGGPSELVGGGIHSENRLFGRLAAADSRVEHQLLEATRAFDLIVTMGSSAQKFFRTRVAEPRCEVIPSGVDADVYLPGREPRDVDLIVVARLVPIKRLDLFLQVVRLVVSEVPDVRAVIIGDGPLHASLEAQAAALNIAGHVTFRRGEPEVAPWLRRAKVFLLTSDTEGVSISMIEAMACGTVPVVSNVGDLADAVTNGRNGVLVDDRSPEAFARAAVPLLQDPARWNDMSSAARAAALRFDRRAIARRWDEALTPTAGREVRGLRKEREQWAEKYS